MGAGASCQTVIDDHRRDTIQRQARVIAAVPVDAAVQLVLLLAGHREAFWLGNHCASHHFVVDDADPVLAQRAEHQPRPIEDSQFAYVAEPFNGVFGMAFRIWSGQCRWKLRRRSRYSAAAAI
ncbi:hypothetical protein ACQPW1_09695 [Nocardia sp. CA-128927]|uniref:hypothetical protein n=1 Tax=Nocardia sp. CA-128927 TaxID=3239975 RepID=UPI003D97FE69